MKIEDLAKNFTFEELAGALYLKGEMNGYSKVTDKTKWREPVMAEKLGHIAHPKISAGKDSDNYGSDAHDTKANKNAEYKTKALDVSNFDSLFQRPTKNGRPRAGFKVPGIYNGAYKQEAIDLYANIDHYFGLFYKERCVLIVKPKTKVVINQLQEGLKKMTKGNTTNLNTVKIDLQREDTYTVMYRDDDFFNSEGQEKTH